MRYYIAKRLLMLIPVILGASLLIYVILDLAPGDIVTVTLGDQVVSAEEMALLRANYGLDKPIIVRYFSYMLGLLRGNIGVSYITQKPVLDSYLAYFPSTIKLALASIAVSLVISIPAGIVAAVKRGKIVDNISMVVGLFGMSIPTFWLGLMLIIVFALNLGWFPSGNDTGFSSIVLPAIAVGTGMTASLTRTTRSAMLDVINQDYLRTVRAKGGSERVVVLKHALKNAMIPILTVIGTQLGVCLGGSVLTETVFAWPGVGRLIIDSVNARDIPMVTGCLIMKTILISVIMLIVDLLYAVVDPRIRSRYVRRKVKAKGVKI
jgi:peptide/nickel transport system permease protein